MTNTEHSRYGGGIGNRKAVGLHLDKDVIEYFKKLANDLGLPYQALMNLYLRWAMEHKFRLEVKMD